MAGWDALLATLGSPLGAADLLGLMGHFMLLSLLSVGGAIATAPDMHRYVVVEHPWLSDAQFSASIALAQAAPGPNVLFVAAIGWHVAGPLGVLATMGGILLPSSVLALAVSRYGTAHREARPVRVFVAGMAPLTLGLLLATGWVLVEPMHQHWGTPMLVAVTVFVMLRTKLSPLWPIALGAFVGAMGWAG